MRDWWRVWGPGVLMIGGMFLLVILVAWFVVGPVVSQHPTP
jgi:hypothetical protein